MTLAQKLTPAPDHPRVAALVAAYARADAAMRDLPIYNPALTVVAHGFTPLDGEGLIGVLITPWFMNLVLLPEAMQPFDPARCGASRKVALPGGRAPSGRRGMPRSARSGPPRCIRPWRCSRASRRPWPRHGCASPRR